VNRAFVRIATCARPAEPPKRSLTAGSAVEAGRFRGRLTVALALLLLVLAPRGAQAQNCRIESVTGVTFGTYDVYSVNALDSVGSITWHCSPSSAAQIALDRGSSPTFNPRTLRSGSEVLSYNLYLDAARTTIWGDGTAGTLVHTGSGGRVTVTIFGRIPAGQDVAPASYADTITAVLNF
jgi:spore coat protein U-like protein